MFLKGLPLVFLQFINDTYLCESAKRKSANKTIKQIKTIQHSIKIKFISHLYQIYIEFISKARIFFPKFTKNTLRQSFHVNH